MSASTTFPAGILAGQDEDYVVDVRRVQLTPETHDVETVLEVEDGDYVDGSKFVTHSDEGDLVAYDLVYENGLQPGEDDVLVEQPRPGFLLEIEAEVEAHAGDGRTIEIVADVSRDLIPVAGDESVEIRTGYEGDFNAVTSSRLQSAIARLTLSDFDEDGFIEEPGTVIGVVEEAKSAAIHRTENGTVTVLTLQDPSEDKDRFLRSTYTVEGDDGEFTAYVVTAKRRVTPRPVGRMVGVQRLLLDDGVQNLSKSDKSTLMADVVRSALEHGEYVVADRDNAVYFSEDPERVFERLGIDGRRVKKYDVTENPHAIRRAGVILGRTGSFSLPVSVPNTELPEAYDGTILVTEEVSAAYQGTLVAEVDGTIYTGKGVIRPPVEGEEEGVGEGALGADLTKVDHAEFYVIDQFGEESSSLNAQAVNFTAADKGEEAYFEWAARIAEGGVEEITTDRGAELIEAGVPAELVVDDRDLTGQAHKTSVPAGYRSKVYGTLCDWIGQEEIALPDHAIERIEESLGRELEQGEELFVLRDPALPNASGIQRFAFAGELDADEGVAICAASQQWLDMGGDFDGDAAVVMHPKLASIGELAEQVEVDTSDVRKDDLMTPGKLSGMHLRRLNKWSQYIGIAASRMERAHALGMLDDEMRRDGTKLVQGAVDSKKHAVDTALLSKIDGRTKTAVQDRLDELEVDPCKLMSEHKNATGDDRQEAWAELVDFAEERDLDPNGPFSAALRARMTLVLEIEEKRQELADVREDDADGLPADMLEQAEVRLYDEYGPAAAKMIAAANRLGRHNGLLYARGQEAGDRLQSVMEDKQDNLLAQAKAAVASGKLPAAAIIAAEDLPTFMKLEIIQPEHVREITGEHDEITDTSDLLG